MSDSATNIPTTRTTSASSQSRSTIACERAPSSRLPISATPIAFTTGASGSTNTGNDRSAPDRVRAPSTRLGLLLDRDTGLVILVAVLLLLTSLCYTARRDSVQCQDSPSAVSWPEQRDFGRQSVTESRLAVYLRRQTRSAWILNGTSPSRSAPRNRSVSTISYTGYGNKSSVSF